MKVYYNILKIIDLVSALAATEKIKMRKTCKIKKNVDTEGERSNGKSYSRLKRKLQNTFLLT